MAIAYFGAPIVPLNPTYSYDYGGAYPLTGTALITQTSPVANSSYIIGSRRDAYYSWFGGGGPGPVYRAMIHAIALGADCLAALYSVNLFTLVETQLSTPAAITNVPYQMPLVDLGDALPAQDRNDQMVLRIWSPSGEGCVWTGGYAFSRPDVWLSADHAHPDTIAVVEAARPGEVVSIVNDLVMEPYLADGADDPFVSDPQPFIRVPAPDHQEVVKVYLEGGGYDLGSDTDEPYRTEPTVFGPEGQYYGLYFGNENYPGTPIFQLMPTGSPIARDQTAPPFYSWIVGGAMSNPQEEQQALPFPNVGVFIGGGNVTNPGDLLTLWVTGGAEILNDKRDCVYIDEEVISIVGFGDGVFVPEHDIILPGPDPHELVDNRYWVPEKVVTICFNALPESCFDVRIPAHWEYPTFSPGATHTVHIPGMWVFSGGTIGPIIGEVTIPAHWDCVPTDDFLYAYARLASGYFIVEKGIEAVNIECTGTLDLEWTHDHPDAIESFDLRIYRGVSGPLVATVTNVTSPYSVDPGYVPPFGAIGGEQYLLQIRANYYDGSWTEDGCFYFPGAASGGGNVAHRFNPS